MYSNLFTFLICDNKVFPLVLVLCVINNVYNNYSLCNMTLFIFFRKIIYVKSFC